MVTDNVGDFIIRLKNAGAIKAEKVTVAHSNHLEAIAKKLKELGFVADVSVDKKDGVKKVLVVELAYDDKNMHKIHDVKRISKPGRRLYVPSHEAHSVLRGMGARILSTPKGVLSDKEARQVRAGGENLFEIW